MELEVREVEASARPRLRTRVDSYRAELGRLSQEFMKVRSPPFQDGMYYFISDCNIINSNIFEEVMNDYLF
jgi:hypothetical protein